MPGKAHRTSLLTIEALEDRITPTISFANTSDFQYLGSEPSVIAEGDLSGNGITDLVVPIVGGLQIMMGDGQGNFTQTQTISLGYQPNVCLADLTGNGILDIVGLDSNTHQFLVLMGNGNGTFQNPIIWSVNYGEDGIAVGDMNGDGLPDVVFSMPNGIGVCMNDGNPADLFSNPVFYSYANEQTDTAGSITLGDFNGDGSLDVAVADYTGEAWYVFMNNGQGVLGTPTKYADPFSGSPAGPIVAGDFTNNGKLDLLASCDETNDLALFMGNGDGTFNSPTLINTGYGEGVGPLCVGDFDNGPNLDFAVGGSGGVLIFPGNGDGTFGSPITVNSWGANAIATGDFTNNGLLDLATVWGQDTGGFVVNLNTSPDAAIDSFNVSAPATVTAGVPFTLTVTAQNDLGDTLLGYTGTIDFSSADQQAGFPASAQFTASDDGVLQVPITLTEVGNLTVNLQDSVVTSATGSTSLTVDPGAISGSHSTVGFATSTDTSGDPDLVTIVVSDAYGNAITGLPSGDFTFSLTGGTSTGSFGTVEETNTPGTYTADFTGELAGTASTLTLTVNGVQLTAQPKVTVTPGPLDPDESSISLKSPTDPSGTNDAVTITVEDAAGNLIGGLLSSDFVLDLSGGTSTGSFGNVTQTSTPGIYSATFTGELVGSADAVDVEVSGVQIANPPQVTVVPGPVDPDSSSFSLENSTDVSGSADTATIVLVDANGNAITDLPSGDFTFSLTGGTSTGSFGTVSETTTLGTYSVSFTGDIAGTASTLTLTVNGVQLTAQPKVTVTPGPLDPDESSISLKSPTDPSGTNDAVTITVEDAAGNLIGGLLSSDFVLDLAGGTSTGSFGNVTQTATPGIYSATFTGELVGSADAVDVEVSGVQIANPPQVTVVPGPVDPNSSSFSLENSTDVSGSADTATIVLVDANGNAITGLPSGDFTFSLTGGTSTGSFGTVKETDTPGTYTADFTGDIAGTTSSIVLTVNGVMLNDEPTVEVTPGPVNGGLSSFSLKSSTDASGTADTATIVVEDSAGNAVTNLTGGDFAFSFSDGSSTGSVGAVTETTIPGTYTANFTGALAGSAITVTLQINDVQLNDEPQVTVTPGSVDADNTSAAFTSATVTAGSTDTVLIEVEDAAGNAIPGLTSSDFDLSLSGGGSDGTFGPVSETSTPGTYSSVFSGINAGTPSSLDLTINAVQIAASPTVQVLPGSPDTANSSVSFASPLDSSGTADTATIVLKDAYGNAITGLGSDAFNFILTGGTSTGSFGTATETSTPGTYTADFTGTLAGSADTLTLTVSDVQLSSQPNVTVIPGSPDAEKTTVNFEYPTVVAGSTDTVTIIAKDAAGNTITNLNNGDFSLSLSGGTSGGTFGPVTQTSTPGTYTAVFTGVTAGTPSSLLVAIDNIAIGDEPTVQVEPGGMSPDTSKVSFTDPTDSSGTTDQVIIELKDAEGNAITGVSSSALVLTLSGGTSTGTLGSVSETTTPGTYIANYTGILAGTAKTLTLKVNGILIESRPSVQVVPGAVSASKTILSLASPDDVSGKEDLLILRVKDAAGNAITGLTSSDLSLTTSGGGTSTSTFATFESTKIPGVYTVLLIGDRAGTTSVVTAVINGTQIDEQPKVTVKHGAVSASTSSASFATPTVASGTTDVLTLVAEDADGNAIIGLSRSDITLSFSGGKSTGTFGKLSATSTPGVYVIAFSGLHAGTASTLTVKIGGVELATKPAVQVVPGVVSATKSTVSLAKPSVVSGGTDTVTIVLKDAAGNSVTGLPGSDFILSLSGGSSGGTFGTVSETSTPGTYTVVFTATTAGTPSALSLETESATLSKKPKVTVTV